MPAIMNFDVVPNTGRMNMRWRGRKSWLSERGAERAAPMYTLIQTAKLNAIDPQAWLANVLARIADALQTRLAELLSWNWHPELSRQKTA
jgi:transposase